VSPESVDALATAARDAAHGQLDIYVVAAPGTEPLGTVVPVITDSDGDFAAQYGATEGAVFLVRPDGYLAYSSASTDRGTGDRTRDVVAALRRTFR
ncbi:MAG: pentachlorophenol monooxygenase, partial [Mycobacterium kyogaense]|uniref:aromatic-ring hydroxylase C-terminal domain-containing protein n=1 Tax=Mycobacterium kyogaense TaxID=2212479 RepID=UPI0030530627